MGPSAVEVIQEPPLEHVSAGQIHGSSAGAIGQWPLPGADRFAGNEEDGPERARSESTDHPLFRIADAASVRQLFFAFNFR